MGHLQACLERLECFMEAFGDPIPDLGMSVVEAVAFLARVEKTKGSDA